MVKQLTILECDCKKGKLEKIAETGLKVEDSHDDHGITRIDKAGKTEFYACDTCNFTYRRDITVTGDRETFTEYQIYTAVPRQIIRRFVWKYKGILSKDDETDILWRSLGATS